MQNGSYSNNSAYGRLHNICRGAGMGFKDATILIDEVIAANKAKLCEKHAEDADQDVADLKQQLAEAEQRAETLKDERDMYDARATEYWEDVLELSDKLEDAELSGGGRQVGRDSGADRFTVRLNDWFK